jgi:hypothetical protein
MVHGPEATHAFLVDALLPGQQFRFTARLEGEVAVEAVSAVELLGSCAFGLVEERDHVPVSHFEKDV